MSDDSAPDRERAVDESDEIGPALEAARRHVVAELVRFADRLKAGGVSVPANGSLEAARALAVVGLDDRARVRAALSATLLSDRSGFDAFEEAFPPFWDRLRRGLEEIASGDERALSRRGDRSDDEARTARSVLDSLSPEDDAPSPDAGGEDERDEPETTARTRAAVRRRVRREATADGAETGTETDVRGYSAVGSRERVDPSVGSDPFSAREPNAVHRFAAALASLPGRRDRSSPTGGRIDARRALRASARTGGVPFDLPARDAATSELRCCLLIDVSGSVLDTIDRDLLLAFAAQLADAARSPRVFLFDTDLVDVTDEFDRADGDPAGALRAAEIDWGGGTRIGGALETLRRSAPDAVDRRTVVLVVSDGLDVGDPDSLEAGISWLSARARAIVWLNPLAVSSQYEPVARGMATCLPFVDGLFGFADADDVAAAAAQLERRGIGGPVGYEYDPRRIGAAADGEVTGDE